MIRPGSYANGFAPRDGQPLYPELWKGCVFAAAPCLGPTGLTLRDWSGLKRHGTLTNMDVGTDWVLSGGRYALDFDGTNDNIVVAANPIAGATEMTCEAWVILRSVSGGFGGLVGSWAAATANRSWSIFINSNAWSFGTGNGTSQALATSGTSAATNQLTHVCGIRTTATNKLYVNGIEVASAATHTGTVTAGNNTTLIGVLRSDDPSPFYANCQVFSTAAWSRALSVNELKHRLLLRPGIAYELAPRHRSSVQVAAFNRRRRLLIGASS